MLMISWEPWDHRQKIEPQDQPRCVLANILAGDFDDYIDEWANGSRLMVAPCCSDLPTR
ncbi:MAG: hypothetical protein R2706_02275 [Acidimicrobiales bacterium]